MLVQGGKDAFFKLLNRAALPGVGDELQPFHLPNGLFSTPAVWTDSANARGSSWASNVVDAFRLQTDAAG